MVDLATLGHWVTVLTRSQFLCVYEEEQTFCLVLLQQTTLGDITMT